MSYVAELPDHITTFFAPFIIDPDGTSYRDVRSANRDAAQYVFPSPSNIFQLEAVLYRQQKPTHRNFFSSIQNAHRYRQDLSKGC